jgi:hypothetical protein
MVRLKRMVTYVENNLPRHNPFYICKHSLQWHNPRSTCNRSGSMLAHTRLEPIQWSKGVTATPFLGQICMRALRVRGLRINLKATTELERGELKQQYFGCQFGGRGCGRGVLRGTGAWRPLRGAGIWCPGAAGGAWEMDAAARRGNGFFIKLAFAY